MKIIGIIAAIVICILSIRVYSVATNPLENGIIMIEGYEHAVAICGEVEGDEEMVTQEGEYHMWAEDGHLYTVNYGHMHDDEINALRALVQVHCNQ